MPISTTIRWGQHAPIDLALDDEQIVAPLGDDEQAVIVDDVSAAVASALAEPLDFPPFAQATVEGDRVAVALGRDLPELPSLVEGLVAGLSQAGVKPCDISFVIANERDAKLIRRAVGDTGPSVVVHDPGDETGLVYVGEMRGDVTLRLNRALAEAELVLPVGCIRDAESSVFDCLFPHFSDSESQQRYAATGDVASDLSQRRDEAGWLLGTALVMQVVPSRGGGVAAVLVGTPERCRTAAQTLAESIWHRQYPRTARLVVAGATGNSATSWQQFARMLTLADELRGPSGAIALCAELPKRLGKSLRHLQSAHDTRSARRKIAHDHDADTHAAAALAEVLERGPVFLLSNLPGEVVEDLGMAPIAEADELVRLAHRMADCIVIDDAHYTTATIQTPIVAGDLE